MDQSMSSALWFLIFKDLRITSTIIASKYENLYYKTMIQPYNTNVFWYKILMLIIIDLGKPCLP